MSEPGLIRSASTANTAPDRALLGGKGASLVELIGLGVPVPPGFVITTAASGGYFEAGELPPRLLEELPAAIAAIEARLGRGFGDEREPLLVSVRSGAPVSMPGMMDTILNVGLTSRTLPGLIAAAGGDEALRPGLLRAAAQDVRDLGRRQRRAARGSARAAAPLDRRRLRELEQQARPALPPLQQAWPTPAPRSSSRRWSSATATSAPAPASSSPATPRPARPTLYGDYLARAQGEDVVAGSHNTADLEGMRALLPDCHAELVEYAARVEAHFGDLCEIEFTVERGKLWLLQARAGQRSAQAAIVAAVQLAEAGLIDRETAISRVNPEQLDEITRPTLDRDRLADATVLATAIGASPGIAIGALAFDSAAAVELAAYGKNAILVRAETSPEDLEGIIACTGLLTLRGGKTSHAAVVTRGLGRPCVCGAEDLQLDADRGELRSGDITVNAGETISIDGDSGHVILGEAPVTEPSPPPEAATLAEWMQ